MHDPRVSDDSNQDQAAPASQRTAMRGVAICGVLLCIVFAVAGIFTTNQVNDQSAGNLIPVITGLFFVGTLVSIVATYFACRLGSSRRNLGLIIVLFAICFRLIQIFSPPFLEIDFYRYLWDGIVVREGMSPYRFAPQQALADDIVIPDTEHRKIVDLAGRSDSIHEIVSRIHFEQYTTIYPPVSQAVFAGAMFVVPENASVHTHILVMKITLVLFDLGTVLVLMRLASVLRASVALVMAYAWNPLVIKEIANSAHLDSIAVFFTVAAVTLVASFLNRTMQADEASSYSPGQDWRPIGAGVLLGLGVGAKLFPVIFAPLIFAALGKRSWGASGWFALLFVLVSATTVVPMLLETRAAQHAERERAEAQAAPAEIDRDGVPGPGRPMLPESKNGLVSFLTNWRMNDIAFTLIYENVTPPPDKEIDRPWYVFVPARQRDAFNRWLQYQGIAENRPFFVARAVTVTAFGLLYLVYLYRFWRTDASPREFIAATFAVIATFFFLQPTQNPWYWMWAIPFVCFVRNRGWWFVSAFLFVYYLRFWFQMWEGEYVLGPYVYSGLGLFDHVVVWLEYAGMLICLTVAWFTKKNHRVC